MSADKHPATDADSANHAETRPKPLSAFSHLRNLDFSRLKTYSIKTRRNKVNLADFSDPSTWEKEGNLLTLFPNILKGNELKEIVVSLIQAHDLNKPVILGMGAHVIKCGLNRIIIDLMEKRLISAIALNGAGAIHDFELALTGSTSEDVAPELGEGRFGMAEETPTLMNEAFAKYVDGDVGLGEALGRYINENNLPDREVSLLARAYSLEVPVTIHVGIGTDITHMHPSTSGELLGKGSMNDFRLFTGLVSRLEGGGCYINAGSAVILPEVFLKALSLARNLGFTVSDFITINLDMIQHYRPMQNVVQRPTLTGGKGYSLTGHHEILIPLLYYLLITSIKQNPCNCLATSR